MPPSGKVLEDSLRLSRIRKIKHTLYVVQVVMLVVLAGLTIFVFGGATVDPYVFIPLDAFVAILVLLLLIICLESCFFKLLEIRFARSSSARHLMAKRSMKRSVIMAAVAAVFAIIVSVPPVSGGIEDSFNDSYYVSSSSYPPYFYSCDVFSFLNTVGVHVKSTRDVAVYIVIEDAFRQYYRGEGSLGIVSTYRLNTEDYMTVDNEINIDLPTMDKVTRFYIVIDDGGAGAVSASITLLKDMSGTFTGLTSLLLIAFVVTNVAWIAYLVPIERKYSAGSIYK